MLDEAKDDLPTAEDDFEPALVQLAALVRRTAHAHPDIAAPAQLSELVLDAIPVGQERQLLQRLLPSYVASVVRRAEGTPAADVDPERAWAGMLQDRVPTAEGYRFLRDCDADDIAAGAERRRRLAENYAARAQVYDVIADQIRTTGASSAGELDADVVVPAVRSVRDPITALADLSHSVITKRLEQSQRLLRLVVIAHARGQLPRPIVDALVRPRLRDACLHVLDDLIGRPGRHPDSELTERDVEALREMRTALSRHLAGDPKAVVESELLEQLRELEHPQIIEVLIDSRETLEAAALADARGHAPAAVADALKDPAVAPAWIAAIDAVTKRLNDEVARQRTGGALVPQGLMDDRRAMQQRRSAAVDAFRAPRVLPAHRSPRSEWERRILREHADSLHSRVEELRREHGIVKRSPMPKAGHGIVAWAIAEGLLDDAPPEAAALLHMPDSQFHDAVIDEALGRAAHPMLRSDWLLDRWRQAMVTIKTSVQERVPKLSGPERIEQVALAMALDAALGESRRLELALRSRLSDLDAENDATMEHVRWQAGNEIIALASEGYLR